MSGFTSDFKKIYIDILAFFGHVLEKPFLVPIIIFNSFG